MTYHFAFIVISSRRGGFMIKGCMMWRWAVFSPLVFAAAGGYGPTADVVSRVWLLALPPIRGNHTAPHFLGFAISLIHSAVQHLPDLSMVDLAVQMRGSSKIFIFLYCHCSYVLFFQVID